MALSPHQQVYEIIEKSNNPLITFGKNFNGDTIASSLAVAELLKKMGKKADIVSADFNLPENYQFLSDASNIKNVLSGHKELAISINLAESEAPHLSQKTEDGYLHIIVKPQNGKMAKEHVKISDFNYIHDLIITLNTPDLEALDHVFHDNSDLFYQVPIINIDHLPENEHYGQINLVNIRATSASEIIYDLIEKLDANLIDESIATLLLTGMIEKTKSFRNPIVTPRSLNTASLLMAAGAERDSIIKNLYQTKTVNTLRLWGKLLLKLQTDTYQKIAWAGITEKDFQETNSRPLDIYGVIDELIVNIPTVELSALFYEYNQNIFCLIKSEKQIDLRERFRKYNPTGNKHLIHFELTVPSEEIIRELKSLI